MEQRARRAPSYNKTGWLPLDKRSRAVARLGLRFAQSSRLAVFGSTVAFLRPARDGAGKTNAHAARLVSWSMWALSTTLTALSLFLLALNLSHPNVHVFDFWAVNTMMAVGCSAVGAVIASRCPENPIGWIFCAIGLLSGVRHLSAQYATYALLAAPDSLPGGEALAWIASWTWVLYLGLYVFLGLLFPNGRLPTRRWRWVAWLSTAVVALGAISVAFWPGPVYGLGPIHNPLGIEPLGITDANSVVRLVLTLVYALGFAMAISLFVRLRRARGVERQQLKWFVYAVAIALSGAIPEYVIFPLINVSVSWVSWVAFILVIAGLVGMPIAIGIAILKYRLYDIDVIINRTLVYGTLSAIAA